jgi:ligand-binding SRPBCC domain-containing protein
MQFVKESVLPVSVEDVFAFHERADAFALLQPPWERTQIITPPTGLEVGTRVELRTRVGPLWIPIVAEHVAFEKNRLFEDIMVRGPFSRWHHRHLFFEHDDGCRLRDEIDYAAPLGWLGRLVDPIAVRPRLVRLFDYRHDVTLREVLAARSAESRG